jgi:dedicator of cytokinesis protein 1
LGSKDLEREKMYFICQIVRIGGMEMRESEQSKQRNTIYNQKKLVEGLRRPFGVAVLEITDVLNGKKEADMDSEIFVPILQCGGEKDSLDSLIKKIINSKSGEVHSKDHKGQGLWISLKMLHGDLKQIREEYPHLVSPLTSLAKKMGFPEVILPGDIRNDLYLTLVSGDFSSKSSNAKNIGVTVRVCDEKGVELQNVITFGAGADLMSEYQSVVYYHEEKPKWMETLRISVPIEDFYNSHLKFIFKHRSSVESKDKNDKPFAFAFMKLMDENGTTLKDQLHNLIIYKVDGKKFDETELAAKYLSLPCTRNDLEKFSNRNSSNSLNNSKALQNQFGVPGLAINLKDSFLISSVVCSTKLTQNIDLLGLLKWSSRQSSSDEDLKNCLSALMKVDGEEIVKFLQDTLDSLFNILMEKDSKEFNFLVFEALVFIIGLISDRKYQHFRPVLDVYIQDNFSATLAYNKLIDVLKTFIDGLTEGKKYTDQIVANEAHGNLFSNPQESFNQRAMKSLEFLFKFIVRSRYLFSTLNGGKNEHEFETSMSDLLSSLTALMSPSSKANLIVQGSCLKYIPYAISDILSVFDAQKLSHMFTNLINSVPIDRLRTQKMVCILDIIHTECLFSNADCRRILMPVFLCHIRLLMRQHPDKSVTNSGEFDPDKMKRKREEELNVCIQVLSEMLSLLCKQNPLTIHSDVCGLINTILPSIIRTVVETNRADHRIGELIAIMIELFRQMTSAHFDDYVNSLVKSDASQGELLLFLIEVLSVFKELVNQPIYQFDWIEMIMIQNSVMLNSVRLIADKVKHHFSKPFDQRIYRAFFHCCISFLTQRSLQLENFSTNKKNKILSRYKDMRKETGILIRCIWFHLDDNKRHFIPDMIGPFLEMALIPDKDLRTIGLRIFFDMMESEYSQSAKSSKIDANANYKNNFNSCEREMIAQLDKQFESGKGDEDFKSLFLNYLGFLCQNSHIRDAGLKFVQTAVRLMKRLLEYRAVIYASEENKENVMLCLMKILEFYHEKEQQEMYVRYLCKLCDLHIKCENFSEAAYVLKLNANLLRWTDDALSAALCNEEHLDCETHRDLKEQLYKRIIEYFDKGKLWEEGLRLCKELATQYENETFNFAELSNLHQKMAHFYENITKQIRHKPEYYRVSFYGRGFPTLLANKTFVYRARPYEKLFDFRAKLLNQFSNAQPLESLLAPGPEITESNSQFVLVNQVSPVMCERAKDKFRAKAVHPQISQYYESNEVQTFSFSRVQRKTNGKESDNEFANMWVERTYLTTSYPLPGILTCFPVITCSSYSLSPIENAIEAMEATNGKLTRITLQHVCDSTLPVHPLSMLLSGVIDAAVMGGVAQYERAFFAEESSPASSELPSDEKVIKLKELIASQVPLLELAITVHDERAPESVRPLHEHLVSSFRRLRDSLESKYGRRTLPIELQESSLVRVRRCAGRSESKTDRVPSAVLDRKSHRISQAPPEASTMPLEAPPRSTSLLGLASAAKTARSRSVFVRPNSGHNSSSNISLHATTLQSLLSSGSSTLTKLRRGRDATAHAFQARKSNHETSHWYDETESEARSTPKSASSVNLAQGGLIELRENLTAQRPLRSDCDGRRHSRPTSGSNFLQVSTSNRSSISQSHSASSLCVPSSDACDTRSEDSVPSLPPHPNSTNGSSSSVVTNGSVTSPTLQNPPPAQAPPPPPPIPLTLNTSLPPAILSNMEDDEPPPPLPAKHSSGTEHNFKFDSNGYTGTFIKQRPASANNHLRRKLPPPVPGQNSPYSSAQNSPIKSPLLSPTRSPTKLTLNALTFVGSNGHHHGRHSTPILDVSAYEQIPPLPKKPSRPVPPLPCLDFLNEKSLDFAKPTKPSDETEV